MKTELFNGATTRLFYFTFIIGHNIAESFGQRCNDFGFRNHDPIESNGLDRDWEFYAFNGNFGDCHLCARWTTSPSRETFTLIHPCLQEEMTLSGGIITFDFFHFNVPNDAIVKAWKRQNDVDCQSRYGSSSNIQGLPTNYFITGVTTNGMSTLQIESNTSRSITILFEISGTLDQTSIFCLERSTFSPYDEPPVVSSTDTRNPSDETATTSVANSQSTATAGRNESTITTKLSTATSSMNNVVESTSQKSRLEKTTRMSLNMDSTITTKLSTATSSLINVVAGLVSVIALLFVVIFVLIAFSFRRRKPQKKNPDTVRNDAFDTTHTDNYEEVNKQSSNVVYARSIEPTSSTATTKGPNVYERPLDPSVPTSINSDAHEYARSVDCTVSGSRHNSSYDIIAKTG